MKMFGDKTSFIKVKKKMEFATHLFSSSESAGYQELPRGDYLRSRFLQIKMRIISDQDQHF